MSSRQKVDYIDVLTSVKNIIGDNSLEEIMIDFESAMWGATRCVFPEVNIKGCTFHWTQAVWEKIQELGLAPAYFNDEGCQIYLRKLMSLPFLPPEFMIIPTVFLNLAAEATTEPIKILTEYINKTWISSRVWPPKAWSCFMQTVRTNNNVEGWHGRINRHAGSGRGQLQFYLLIDLLFEEAEYVAVQTRMICQETLSRCQRKEYREINKKLLELWGEFNNGNIGAKQLLRSCAKLYRPTFRKGEGSTEDDNDNTNSDLQPEESRVFSNGLKKQNCYL